MGFSSHQFLSLLPITITFLIPSTSQKTHLKSNETEPTLVLDNLIRDYSFKCYSDHPKTAFLYSVRLPERFSGLQADTVRYRSGSLRRYGAQIKEFHFSPGIIVSPYVERLVLVREKLEGNWSSMYYNQKKNISGFDLVTPLLGLLAYNADHLNATNPSRIRILAAKNPITIDFSGFSNIGFMSFCAFFSMDGKVSVYNQTQFPNVCVGFREGHYGLVVGSHKEEVKKVSRLKVIVAGFLGGVLGAVLLGLLVVAMVKKKKRSRIAEMERRAYEEEGLRVTMVGSVRVPVAPGTRTMPVLENDYTP
ncbi:uncharacterized protein LOC143880422 [Tasmannia lanceolata]|uniref:uncharacterized protein LOC143880422 n=1 Tax=Tasmannia lanceolata TaxID=3420 RepID=UPI0040639E0D